jgi:hypothetical protein
MQRFLGRARLPHNIARLWTLALGFLAAVLLHWTATGAEEHIKARFQNLISSPYFYAPCGLATLLGSYLVWARVEHHRHIRDVARLLHGNRAAQFTAGERKCDCVICFLSPQKPVLLKQRPAFNEPVKLDDGATSCFLPRESLDADIAALANSPFAGWNWEPLLRSLRDHRQTVRSVYLLGSEGDKGSYREADIACDLLRGYFPDSPLTVQVWDKPLPFEDVEHLEKALRGLIEKVTTGGTPLDRICVDVTGGQKTTSVAGVLATLKTPVLNQYVQPGGNRKVLVYDLRFESALELFKEAR